jgi:hypothetical protein
MNAVEHEVNFDEYEEAVHESVTAAPQPTLENIDYVPLLVSDIKKMKVKELRGELAARNQRQSGHKNELMERLIQSAHLPPVMNPLAPNDAVVRPTDSCFDPSAKWEFVQPDFSRRLEEPSEGTGLVGPTTHAAGASTEAAKYHYPVEIDRDPFTALAKEYVCKANGEVKKDRAGKPIMNDVIRKKGRPKLSFLEKNKLTIDSHPAEWFASLMPDQPRSFDPPQVACIDQWVRYLNLKAALAQAGSLIYPDFIPFKTEEFKKHIGLFILNGLSPSPQISQKLKSQKEDPVNGSDICCDSFGPNAERRHKHFRCFFAVQNPLVATPSTKTHPNHKVDPFLHWMQTVSIDAWDFGEFGSCDEQCIGFTGNHKDKQRINYKKEGDGFLADSICEEGYTYAFFFRNQPAPAHYLNQGFSPTHARVLFLFDTLPSKNHVIGLDNLFMSAKLAWGAYNGKNQVKIHGVVRRHNRGVPSCVFQEDKTKKEEIEAARGTLKAAILKDDNNCPDLCVISYYDSKVVYLMSTSNQSLNWRVKERKVFDKSKNKLVSIKFLRHEMIDDYNNGMNHVDRADQLRGTYRFDHWMRTRKWWWSIWMWGFQVLLTNAYVLYKTAHVHIWKLPAKKLLSHYQFRKMIALAWINPSQFAEGNKKNTKRKYSNDDISCARSTRSYSSARERCNSTQKGAYISDESLHPHHGALKIRLSGLYHHCPARPHAKDPTCSLHRWASEDNAFKRRGNIMKCDCCNVNLCIDCFPLFHRIEDVKKLKSEIKKIIQNEKKM